MDEDTPGVVVHLVHGTWPRGFIAHKFPAFSRVIKRIIRLGNSKNTTAWFDPGSEFRAELAARCHHSILVRSFKWSGDNSQRAREMAARKLNEHLAKWQDRMPESKHVVVGHSHGGNIALWATGKHSSPLRRPVDGIVTLATPFLEFRAFQGTAVESIFRYYPVMFVPLALICAAGAVFVVPLTHYGTMLNAMRGCAAAALVSGIALSVASLLPRDLVARYRNLQMHGAAPAARLLVIRAAGDEASLALATSQLVAYIGDRAWHLLVRPAKVIGSILPWPLLMSIFTLGLLELCLFEPITRIPLLLRIPAFISLVLLVLLVASTLVMLPTAILMTVAVGPEMFRSAFISGVRIEAVPSGWEGRVANLSLAKKDLEAINLSHSLHALRGARARVARWIDEIASDPVGVSKVAVRSETSPVGVVEGFGLNAVEEPRSVLVDT